MKIEKGITLIALVITIIVLVILAGVSISVLTGESGLINKAMVATEKTEIAEIEEQVNFAVGGALAVGEGVLIEDNLIAELDKSFGTNYELQETETGWVIQIDGYEMEVNGKKEENLNDFAHAYTYSDEGWSGKLFPTDNIDGQIIVKFYKTGRSIDPNISETVKNMSGELEFPKSDEYKMIISGIGEMAGFEEDNGAWIQELMEYIYKISDEIPAILYVSEIVIEEGIETISADMFALGAAENANIKIPASLREIPINEILSGIGDFEVSTENEYYSSEDGVLYNKDKTELIRCSAQKSSFVVPNTVNTLSAGAFTYCSNLINVEISNTITKLSDSCFWGCDKLKSVKIANSVTSIENDSFYGCESLETITIPESVENIAYTAFNNCVNLHTVILLNASITIDSDAFKGCTNLQYVKYAGTEENWQSVSGNDAFSNATIEYNYVVGE